MFDSLWPHGLQYARLPCPSPAPGACSNSCPLSQWHHPTISFLPRSKRLFMSWLQSLSAVILEPKKIKSVIVSVVSPSVCYEVMGRDAVVLVFWMLSFKPAFSFSFFTFIKKLFSSSSLWHYCGIICISEVIDISPTILIPACASSSLAFRMM